ncbi:MAG TPA: hypothetical protein VGL58_05360 [Caulobacteraceae bacterium]|jgi:hypothetical protein
MDPFWEQHWWLIIILAPFAVAAIQALFAPWRRYLTYRERRDAIEALKVYATQGKEPPPDVVAALRGGWRRRAREAASTAAFAAADASVAWQDGRWARGSRWRARMVMGQWNWAIFAGAIAGGFAYASQHVAHGAETYMVVAIIAGALTLAGVVSALMATFLKVD